MLFSFLLSLRIAVILEKNQNQSFALRVLLALFYRQKYADAVHRDIGTDGTYSAYFPFGDMRDVQLMPYFHDKCTANAQQIIYLRLDDQYDQPDGRTEYKGHRCDRYPYA